MGWLNLFRKGLQSLIEITSHNHYSSIAGHYNKLWALKVKRPLRSVFIKIDEECSHAPRPGAFTENDESDNSFSCIIALGPMTGTVGHIRFSKPDSCYGAMEHSIAPHSKGRLLCRWGPLALEPLYEDASNGEREAFKASVVEYNKYLGHTVTHMAGVCAASDVELPSVVLGPIVETPVKLLPIPACRLAAILENLDDNPSLRLDLSHISTKTASHRSCTLNSLQLSAWWKDTCSLSLDKLS